MVATKAPDHHGALGAILDAAAITARYQPIVRLADGATVGYEALSRGPAGHVLESPAALFAAAHDEEEATRLDWACRRAALQGALASRQEELTLFVNVEPLTLARESPPDLDALAAEVARRGQLVLEVTERALTDRPAEVLANVRRAKRQGWRIAVDDVGADERSLALLPFLDPDVIKLDLRLVQARPDRQIAATMTAVLAAAERTGAAVLAEGIETETQRATALGLGATLGQGYLYGRPGPLPAGGGQAAPIRFPRRVEAAVARSPFSLLAAARIAQTSTKSLLVAMSKHLEEQASRLSPPGVVVSCFQLAEQFSSDTVRRYRRLASVSPLVVALGREMAHEPAPGVRGGDIAPDDPLVEQWAVAVVGPHYAAALVAHDLGDRGRATGRRFDAIVTHDRELALGVARSLLSRLRSPAG